MVPSLSQSCLFSMLFYSNFSGLSSFLSLIKRIPVVWCFCNWLFIVLFLIPSLSLLISPVSFSCQYHFMFLHFGFPFETDVHFLYPYTNSTVHCFFCVMNLHLSPFSVHLFLKPCSFQSVYLYWVLVFQYTVSISLQNCYQVSAYPHTVSCISIVANFGFCIFHVPHC